jgi:hypothetical protein
MSDAVRPSSITVRGRPAPRSEPPTSRYALCRPPPTQPAGQVQPPAPRQRHNLTLQAVPELADQRQPLLRGKKMNIDRRHAPAPKSRRATFKPVPGPWSTAVRTLCNKKCAFDVIATLASKEVQNERLNR